MLEQAQTPVTRQSQLEGFPIECLTCYQLSRSNKIRLGKNYDGGYVIVDGFSYDVFLSGGINRDDSFERAFLNRHENVDCYAFDGTIQKYPNPGPRVHFTKKNISGVETEKTTNLHQLIDKHENIFLKMDIERGEYPWLQSLSKEQLQKFRQITIEFHRPFEKERWECLEKLADTHYLVHLHGNNYQTCSLYEFGECEEIVIGNSTKPVKILELEKTYPENTKLVIKKHPFRENFSYRFHGDKLEFRRLDMNLGWGFHHVAITNAQYVPNVFECTYVRKTDAETSVQLNTQPFPGPIDMPNHSKKVDIHLSGFPYTA